MRFHSYIGLITNSSSETYLFTASNSVKQITFFIDAILAQAGVPISATDLFDISLAPTDSYIEETMEIISDRNEEEDKLTDQELVDLAIAEAIGNIEYYIEKSNDNYSIFPDEGPPICYLKITPKNPEASLIINNKDLKDFNFSSSLYQLFVPETVST
jgi:hypothetical protein